MLLPRRRAARWLAACCGFALAGCGLGPSAFPEVDVALSIVPAVEAETWELDAVLPSQ